MQLTSQKILKLGLFTPTQLLEFGNNGLVIEKMDNAITIYFTDANHKNIYSAIPLGTAKAFKNAEFNVKLYNNSNDFILIKVLDYKIFASYTKHICSINSELQIFDSEHWGQNVQIDWEPAFDKLFN